MSFEERLVAHFNRPRPSKIKDVAGISDSEWELNDLMLDRVQNIVKMFVAWDETTGPCPINPMDEFWFTKLCGMAEWIVLLEAKLDPAEFTEEPEAEEDAE